MATGAERRAGRPRGVTWSEPRLPLSDELGPRARSTPNHCYLSRDPLVSGVAWGHAVILPTVTAAVVAAAVVAFQRRDIGHG